MNTKYELIISYGTGDSFSNHDEVSELGLVFENGELAKRAAKLIVDHYKYITHPFWMGYFETLYSVRVKAIEKNLGCLLSKKFYWKQQV